MAWLIGLVATSAFVLRLQDAVELGGDEGFELVKAFLCNRGYHLYTEIWSDQPSLYTQILSALFAVTGNSVFFARLLSLIFSFGLLSAVFDLVRHGSGPVAAWCAAVILATSPILPDPQRLGHAGDTGFCPGHARGVQLLALG